MQITVQTSTLTKELFKVQGIVSTKTTTPICQTAKIEATSDGRLRIHATDHEMHVLSEVECEVAVPGIVAVRARELYDVLKNLRSDRVKLQKEDNNWLLLTAGSVRARLVGMDPAEFPNLPRLDEAQFIEVRTAQFVRMIDRTIFSICTDEARPNLTGALVKRTNANTLVMVSTDGHRLSVSDTRVEFPDHTPARLSDGVIIPRKGLAELRRTLDMTIECLQLGFGAGSVVFRFGATSLYSKVIDGAFPNFLQVIPEEKPERKAYVDRAEMLSRLKFVSLFASSKTQNLALKFEDGTATISAQDIDKGECEESIQITYVGKPVKAGYNYKYLLDVLSVAQGDQVSIEMIDTLSPTIIHELEGEDGDNSLFIVMPMRL